MKKRIPNETLDAIVADKLFFKLGTDDIAEKHGLSRAFVNATVATFKNVSAGNWEKIQFMLDGGQMRLETAEWAAAKCGTTVPESFYEPKPETKPVLQPLSGQTQIDEFGKKIDGDTTVKFGTSANNTIHALIDALNRNAEESAQLRQAVFALLHSAAVVE